MSMMSQRNLNVIQLFFYFNIKFLYKKKKNKKMNKKSRSRSPHKSDIKRPTDLTIID